MRNNSLRKASIKQQIGNESFRGISSHFPVKLKNKKFRNEMNFVLVWQPIYQQINTRKSIMFAELLNSYIFRFNSIWFKWFQSHIWGSAELSLKFYSLLHRGMMNVKLLQTYTNMWYGIDTSISIGTQLMQSTKSLTLHTCSNQTDLISNIRHKLQFPNFRQLFSNQSSKLIQHLQNLSIEWMSTKLWGDGPINLTSSNFPWYADDDICRRLGKERFSRERLDAHFMPLDW